MITFIKVTNQRNQQKTKVKEKTRIFLDYAITLKKTDLPWMFDKIFKTAGLLNIFFSESKTYFVPLITQTFLVFAGVLINIFFGIGGGSMLSTDVDSSF